MRSPQPKSPHLILGVPADATTDDIRAAYKKQALRWHPDRSREDIKSSTEHFIQVNSAYNALMRDRGTSHPEHGEKGSSTEPKTSRSNMPHGIAYPTHVSASSSTSSSTRTMSSFDSCGQSTAPSSPPQSMDARLDDEDCGPFGKFQSVRSTEATIDEGSVESLLEDWISVSGNEDRRKNGPSHDHWNGAISTAARHHPDRHPTQQYPPRHPNPSHTHLHDYHHPIYPKGTGTSQVWRYALVMSLEDLFHGRHYRFKITRVCLSGKKEIVMLNVDVPAGSPSGTIISCLNSGHQRRDGSFQDILFVVEEAPHETYARVGQDLVIKVHIPWTSTLRRKDGRIHFGGIDERMLCARISYARERRLVGQQRIREGGMPILSHGRVVGRGDVIVQWEIIENPATSSRWTALKSWLRN